MPYIICNNVQVIFEPNSLTYKQAYNLIMSLNKAYMKSLSITCAPYVPTEQTDSARFITACQLVHDNLEEYEQAQALRNVCLINIKP